MALIEMQADLKQTNLLLERLTRALERVLYELTSTEGRMGVRYGHMAEPATDRNPDERPTVEYASDEATMKHELLKIAGMERDAPDGWQEP